MNVPVSALNVPQRYQFSVDEFLKLNDSGAFAECGKTELIEGEIFFMNSQWSRHARIKSNLLVELTLALRSISSEFTAICEVSVHLSENSMPEPDIVLTNYAGDKAVPLDTVALIVEVSDTTLATDLCRKAKLYAQAGVGEYWVVDVEGSMLHQHWLPGDSGYANAREVALGRSMTMETLVGVVVGTGGLA